MKITVNDSRMENREQSTMWGERAQDDTTVVDKRTLVAAIDREVDGEVPEVLPDTTDGTIDHFFVDRVNFVWERTLSKDWRIIKQGWGGGGGIVVSGTNCRKDGSRGAKTGATRYPTYHEEQDGVITEADYAYYRGTERFKREGDFPDSVKAQFGKPRMVMVADPLPAWLEKIVTEYHPVTGSHPYVYGDTHVYGEFSHEAHAAR